MNDDLLQQITIDDLDGIQRDLAEVIGMESYRALVRTYGGCSIPYIPRAENLTTPIRDRLIVDAFNGYNYTALALRYGLSERWIREITREKADKMRTAPLDGQTTFFDTDE